jgi:uncharacterized protein (DUF2141 family)
LSLFKRYTILLLGWIIFFLALQSCANRGSGPQGGPKDTIPPVLLSAFPANGSTNFSANIITLEFNELVSVNNPLQNVIFSPPQKSAPTVKALGKKVNIVLQDSLQPNTTYTIDIKNCIVDYTESNPFPNYVYSFSTGDRVDSLQISGKVIDAQTLAAKKNYTVGIYKNLSDTAFTTQKFDRFTRTNENGEFTIYGVAEGEYNIFAINDAGGAYYYQNKGTDIAFINTTVTPSAHLHGKVDTLWTDKEKTKYEKVTLDAFYEYYPNDLLLKTFKEKIVSHRLKSYKRTSANKISLLFSEPQDIEPTVKIIGEDSSDALLKERTYRADSIIYWVKDSLLYQKDSINLSVSYIKTDSTGAHVAQTDTLNFIYRETKATKRRKEKSTTNHVLSFSHNLNRNLEVYDTIKFVFEEPIKEIIKDSIKLSLKVDTIYQKVDYTILMDDSLCTKKIYLLFKKELGGEYQVNLDSASITSIYGKTINAFKKPIKIKKLEEYSNLYIKFNGNVPNGIVQLINEKDVVIHECPVQNAEAYFEDVTPMQYYIRMYIDENGNKKWDTGNLEEKKQPEMMYYYPKKLQLRANWDVEETWPYKNINILKQRPEELVKKDLTAK